MKPLNQLLGIFYRKPIPFMSWTPALIELFNKLKTVVRSSPGLARFDPDKPTFLNTDWIVEGMVWILIHPADNEESQQAVQLSCETGECIFDLSKNGARLRPLEFVS